MGIADEILFLIDTAFYSLVAVSQSFVKLFTKSFQKDVTN